MSADKQETGLMQVRPVENITNDSCMESRHYLGDNTTVESDERITMFHYAYFLGNSTAIDKRR